ncbi:DUF4397 domain-containing protein [Myxococcus stipitatus]|uniref:DUF4397 domain-containing protein n=1 Tax=Myxococcus stipitatus TaxID=83455 RepID=UPI001F367CF5|nr:DUF4397 domain-containing protein [Myxococcus stipitatus]MCE9669178.1 DUF4397 domain-containing protein [Myxococcus stipitatus]
MPPPTCADGGTPLPDGGCVQTPPTCADGGTPLPDGGCMEPPPVCDGGVASPDGGCGEPHPSVAYVRFVNASLGLKDNPSDSDSAPWRPYRLDVRQGTRELFDAVAPGEEAVTGYQEVPAGTALEFTVSDAEVEGGPVLARSEPVTLAQGERLTLVSVGFSNRLEVDRVERARLLALREAFDAPVEGKARMRLVAADRVTIIPEQGRTRRLGLESASATPVVTLNPYSADAAAGVAIPATTRRLVISTSGDTGFAPALSKRLFFSLPEGALPDGSAWFAVLTGDDRRPLPDAGQPALLLVRAGVEQSLRLKRDPLLYVFNALLPVDENADPLVLQVLQGTTKVAVGSEFNFSPVIGELPVTTTGHSLRVARNDDTSATVVADGATGPLVAGGRYLAVVTGRAGQTSGAQAPRLLVVQDRYPTGVMGARVRVLNAISNGPREGVDFGYFDVAANGTSKGTVFTPVVTKVAFGDLTGPDDGVAFPAPVTTGTTPLNYYGLRLAGAANALAAQGNAMERPHFIVLFGDWDVGFLLFLGFNVRENTWSGVAPFDVFQ